MPPLSERNESNVTPGPEVGTGTVSVSAAGGLSYREQVEKTTTADDLCQAPGRPYLFGLNHELKRAVYFQPRCKSWGCPACAKTNRELWSLRARHGAEVIQALNYHNNFLTITSHEKLDAAGSLAVWPKAWMKLSARARYKSGGFMYLGVPEQHKDGRLHFHAIESAGLGERWWKDNARECGLGYMAEEEIARTPQGAAFYVVKYVTKSIEYQEWPRGFRRVRTSQNWPKLPENEQAEGWTFKPLPVGMPLADKVAALLAGGFVVEHLNHRSAWDYIKENSPE